MIMEEFFLNHIKESLEMESRKPKLSDEFRQYDEWDSMARLSLIAMLDEEYSLQIEDDKFQKILTLSDLLGLIEMNKKG